jgi:hypothetical protein
MTFITPTIPADANPGPLVYAELETALLGVGYTLEDTVVIGARTHKVLKSAAAGNTRGLDWYLDVSYPTTGVATGLLLAPFEGYDPATDVALRGPISTSSSTLDATTYSRYGATASALETNWANTGSHTSLDTPLSTASFGVWASVTRDRVVVMASTEPTQASYAGFFTPTAAHIAHAGAALFPLVMTRLSGATDRASSTSAASSPASVTRLPKMSSVNWGAQCIVGPNTMRMNGKVGSLVSEIDGRVTSAPFVVGLGWNTWTGAGTVPANFAGELDGVQCAWADGVVTRGDTVTVDGDTYVTSTVSSNACILIKQV